MKNKPKISPVCTSDTFAEKKNIPAISVPFPPNITTEDFLKRRKDGSLPSRSMNSFMLYRAAFNKEIRTKRLCVKQKKLSRRISDSWQNEPEHVKRVYRRLAIRAQQELEQKRNLIGSGPFFVFAADDRFCYSEPFNLDNINSNENIINDHSPAEAASDSYQITSINNDNNDENHFNSGIIEPYKTIINDNSPAEATSDSFQITSINNENNDKNPFNLDNIKSYENIINVNSPMLFPAEAAPDSIQINNGNNDENSFNSDNINSHEAMINDNSLMFFPAEVAPDSIQITSTKNENYTQDSFYHDDNLFKNYLSNFLPIPELSSDGTFMDINYLTL
ncbi:7214_t:CDS:1 [Ambispora leptoticha]|uniref:7214_t:CDS:1 n=1 Tax=Ambispora leptoticha TaxID=144679 RepID=A0A9N9D0R3_9GLOM|nr:7214_t:CDS:1 [Ambispora leptoticha]